MKEDKLKDCDCNDWLFSMPQINSAQMLVWNRGIPYTGKQFKYCPWCGKRREIDYDFK